MVPIVRDSKYKFDMKMASKRDILIVNRITLHRIQKKSMGMRIAIGTLRNFETRGKMPISSELLIKFML